MVVVNRKKIGKATKQCGDNYFVEPVRAKIPISPNEKINDDDIGCWHNKREVVTIIDHIKSISNA